MASKIIPEPEEMDQLILDTIRKIRKSKKRAYSDLVCEKLSEAHGLDKSPAMLQLTSMIATGRIGNIPTKEGLESLRIDETKVNLYLESQVENGKSRKLSNDEVRIIECRNELQAVAEAERQVSADNDQSCDSDMESDSDSDTESIPSESVLDRERNWLQDGLVCSQKSGLEKDETLQNKEKIGGKTGDDMNQIINEQTGYKLNQRMDDMEKKLSYAINMINKKENEENNVEKKVGYHGLLARIYVLENEKRDLSLENVALKNKLSDLKKLADVGNFHIPKEKKSNPNIGFGELRHARPNVVDKKAAGMTRDLLETNDIPLWGVSTKAPRSFQPMPSQETKSKIPDSEYTFGNRRRATTYNDSETEISKDSQWEVPTTRKAARSFQPKASQVATRNRYQVLENEDIASNHRGNTQNELNKFQTEESKVADRPIARGANPESMTIPGRYKKSREEETFVADSNNERRFVATERNIMPGIYDYNEVVKMRPNQSRINQYNPFAETTPWGTVGMERNVVPGENSYSEAVRKHSNENNEAHHAQARSTSRENKPSTQLQLNAGSFQRPNRKRPVISLVGDSIIKGIRKNEISQHVKYMSIFVKTFPGATTDDMESYIVPTLKREPDALIIHCGTNDLRKDDPETIAKKITEIAVKSKRIVQNVAVSSILARGDSDLMEGKRLQVNSLLAKSLAENKIHFIRHENVDQDWRYLLYEDGIHLNNDGTNVLGQDFVNYINTI